MSWLRSSAFTPYSGPWAKGGGKAAAVAAAVSVKAHYPGGREFTAMHTAAAPPIVAKPGGRGNPLIRAHRIRPKAKLAHWPCKG